jgi:hypothetical protein
MKSGLGQKAFFITLGGPKAHDTSVEKHFHERPAELQIPRLPRISCRELRLRPTACGSL